MSEKINDVIRFLRDIIAIPSFSTGEKEVTDRIESEMIQLGYDEVFRDDIGNIIGRIGSGPVKILYDSHIDTVGVGDPEAWSFDPFEGKIENNRIFGRGASDNKGATATMVHGAARLLSSNLKDQVTIYVVGTVQEEDCDGLAMHHLISSGTVTPDFVVLGECTGLNIYRGHRGRMEIKITVGGKACHASAPERGDNALYKMSRLILEIEKLNERLADDPFLGKGTVAVTMLDTMSGSLNTVPDKAVCYLDRRLTVGEDEQSSIAELNSLPGADDATIEVLRYKKNSYTGKTVTMKKYFPTWVLDEDHILVEAGLMAGEKVLGKRPKLGRWTFSTNGVASMGLLGIPTIGFGPSEEKYAHSTDDSVTIEHLEKAVDFYAAFPSILLELLNKKER